MRLGSLCSCDEKDWPSTGLFLFDLHFEYAEIAQLGERLTEDLKVPGSIPGFGRNLRSKSNMV
jgi:hypothetical protein